MNIEHTPPPWHVGMKPGPIIYDESGNQIADMHDPMPYIDNLVNKANAVHIVRCVNAHDDLLAALQSIVDWADRRMEDGSENTDKRLTWRKLEQARAATKKATT